MNLLKVRQSTNSNNPSAGSAEPSWFEWQTGLLYLLEMLDEDSEVASVAFQIHGVKGWDDVGVHFRNGKTRLYQMKHSRSGNNLTFGDLIAVDKETGKSLLRSLANAWKEVKAKKGALECVLITNRDAGPNWWDGRPPLVEFVTKMKSRIECATAVVDLRWTGEDKRYRGAWKLFLGELSDLGSQDQLRFLKAFEVKTSAPDLKELDGKILQRLAQLTGLPSSSVNSLFNALHANLRKWTSSSIREKEWIDRESLRACLAREEASPPWLGHCDVETPDPFFPSREAIIDTIRSSILDASSAHKVDFVSAEPGAGKTSCISKLARCGTLRWQEQSVSVRFFAYRPIRPGMSDVGTDAGDVRPEALWLGLLWQIRDFLRKTRLLRDLNVPVWLGGMTWEVGRSHVLRIANELGERWNRRFVICIDGIDHAARASRKNLPQFLDTLPLPAAIPENVRILLAGQPAESYDEYPFFLRHSNAAVKVHHLAELEDGDLRLLWRAAKPLYLEKAEDAVIRLLAEKTLRRTLPAVYAVEDIRALRSLEDVAVALDARPLADSLHQYYDSIWSSAAISGSDSFRLAAAFALLRERPDGELLASAFAETEKPASDWTDMLRALRPLVRETAEGFELVHNDLRVHLDGRISGDTNARRDAAMAFAAHYRKPGSDRNAAHHSLLDLLVSADQEAAFADDFTVEWVIDSGAIKTTEDALPHQCSAAFRGAIARRDWLLLHRVACAALTVQRLNESARNQTREDLNYEVPIFLPMEGEPLALELWTDDVFSELLASCYRLLNSGAQARAKMVLKQWCGGIPLERFVDEISTSKRLRSEHSHGVDDTLRHQFERFGRLIAGCGGQLQPFQDNKSEDRAQFLEALEVGWAQGLSEAKNRRLALRLWATHHICFPSSWVTFVKGAAERSRWGEVRALLNRGQNHATAIDRNDLLPFGWYAARAKPRNLLLWEKIFRSSNYGLVVGHSSLSAMRIAAQWIAYSDPVREPGEIAENLFPCLEYQSDVKDPAPVRLIIRASALLGRMLRYFDRGDLSGVSTAVPPSTLQPYLVALWCCDPDWRNLPHHEFQTPQEVGRSLADLAWATGLYRDLLQELSVERFPKAIIGSDGVQLFDILWDCSETEFLDATVREKAEEIKTRLHEIELSSRDTAISNLLHFASQLELPDLEKELADRLAHARIGYLSHEDWIFSPLVRWFEILRKQSPSRWRAEGLQLIELDRICDEQHGDNSFSSMLFAEVGAAAIACGPDDFEALFTFLAGRETRSAFFDLSQASDQAFKTYLAEDRPLSEEAILALTSLAVAFGRWPTGSPVVTVSSLINGERESPRINQAVWGKAISVAAGIQGVAPIVADDLNREVQEIPTEQRTADDILHQFLDGTERSWMPLNDIAALAEQADAEGHANRDRLIDIALAHLEKGKAFDRYVEQNSSRLMARLYAKLKEEERWRLLGIITSITGDARYELSDAYTAFTIAFLGVDLTCRARATERGHTFTSPIFNQLIDTHLKWNGVNRVAESPPVRNTPSLWPDSARRMLLLLSHTEGCGQLYLVMCGLRFLAEVFPSQIPIICREGLHDELAAAILVPLAQLWATRNPNAIASLVEDFSKHKEVGTFEDRFEAWAVISLFQIATGQRCQNFVIPTKESGPEILFPGDSKLLDAGSEQNGLIRHNSFSGMANKRVSRAGGILGSMDVAFRHLVRTMRESVEESPSFFLGPPKRFVFDEGNYPRPGKTMENLVGDAIMHQCAGESWSPAKAAAVRLSLGYGMDPWIASATPNPWPVQDAWPSEFDVESWIDAGTPANSKVAQQIEALLRGEDLDPTTILLGAYLRIPTYKRDLEYRLWLSRPELRDLPDDAVISFTPTGRTLANWVGGWAFANGPKSNAGTVQYCGSLVNYPNGELELTPTSQWIREWKWKPDLENALCFRAPDGKIAAWYERWLGIEKFAFKPHRFPHLNRWIANRDCLPANLEGLRNWDRRKTSRWELLKRPE